MKRFLLCLSSVALLLACESEEIVTQEFQTNPLVGEWQLVEQNVSIGGPSTWQPVEDGDSFTLNADGSFAGFQLFTDCATGDYEATEDELILTYDCQNDTKPFTYFLQREAEDIILSPKTVICTETCLYRYRKVQE